MQLFSFRQTRYLCITVLLLAGLISLITTTASNSLAAPLSSNEQNAQTVINTTSSLDLLQQAGESLLARHVNGPGGGWAWRSVIQAPHLQTDRDVGASSVAMGLLALWETTHQQRYLDGARQAGDWLLAVAQPDGGGLRWPDYYDAPGHVSNVHFTSFDDGAAGIGDLLWRLGSATGDPRYTNAALAAMRWEQSRAEAVGSIPCPQMCRWHWRDPLGPEIFTGMGEGIAGIVYTFDTFAERTGNATYEQYALGGAAYLESLITPAGATPEQPGTTLWDTGFLSGSAGDAFLFLRLYQRTHNARYLADAQRLLNWVRSKERPQPQGVAWPIMLDPHGGNNNQLATGVEEGNAGIGCFLHDLWLATNDNTYQNAALAAVSWLRDVAFHDQIGLYWYENRQGDPPNGTWHLPQEPSWHWGTAGMSGFLARMNGWTTDMPGEEPGL